MFYLRRITFGAGFSFQHLCCCSVDNSDAPYKGLQIYKGEPLKHKI